MMLLLPSMDDDDNDDNDDNNDNNDLAVVVASVDG
jgi:hypothetical protein